MSDIYNKNAREKALLEEAYAGVYQESAVDVELDHWWDFDIDDVIRKVYHGAKRQLPPEDPTEYEEASEKIVIWLKDKYPKPNDYNINDVKFQSRTTADATEWAKRQNKKDEDAEKEVDPKIKAYRNYMWDVGEYRKDTTGYDHPPTASDYGLEHDEIADLARRAHAPEDDDKYEREYTDSYKERLGSGWQN